MRPVENKGLLIVYTGTGKGKTTAAMGMALRALGHGLPVCLVQFIKGTWLSGELEAARRFEPLFEYHVLGQGFTWGPGGKEQHAAMALEAWAFAEGVVREGRHRLVILDELTYLVQYGILTEETVLDCLAGRPEGMHVVITGRGAGRTLMDRADLVSVVCQHKHPMTAGVSAQKGIEY